jgi:hypothetical protein
VAQVMADHFEAVCGRALERHSYGDLPDALRFILL